jgi:Na+-translocating ferredoxin:NAD+ oxidoreductase RnfG subunit
MEQVKRQSAIERFAVKKPILYSTVIMTVLALICGAVLGVANHFLKVETVASEGINEREQQILSIIAPSESYDAVDLADATLFPAGDKTTYGIVKAFRATGAKNTGAVILVSSAKGYAGRDMEVMSAFAKDDKVLGVRPYTEKSASSDSGHDKTYNQAFFDAFTGKTAETLSKYAAPSDLGAGADTYTSSTVTAGAAVTAAANAAKYYGIYKRPLQGQALTPLQEAAGAIYPGAGLNLGEPLNLSASEGYTQTDGIDSLTVYRAYGIIPIIVAKIDDNYSVVLYFGGVGNTLSEVTEANIAKANAEVTAEAPAVDDPAVEAAIEKGEDFFEDAVNKEKLLEVFTADDKEIFKNLLGKETGETETGATYTPVLGAMTRGEDGNRVFSANVQVGTRNLYKLLKVSDASDSGTYYIGIAQQYKGYDAPFTVYTLFKEDGGSFTVEQAYVKQDQTDSGDHYAWGFYAANNNGHPDSGYYREIGKFSLPINGTNYQGDIARTGGESAITDEEDTHSTMSYDAIINGIKYSIQTVRDTFNIT